MKLRVETPHLLFFFWKDLGNGVTGCSAAPGAKRVCPAALWVSDGSVKAGGVSVGVFADRQRRQDGGLLRFDGDDRSRMLRLCSAFPVAREIRFSRPSYILER